MIRALVAVVTILASAGSAMADEKIGQWVIDQNTDAMTDAVTISATAYSGQDGGLIISCKPEKPGWRRVMFVHLPYLGSGSRVATYRFDDDEAVTKYWVYTAKAATLANEEEAARFVSRLETATRVRIRAATITMAAADGDFDVTGAAEMLAHLKDRCEPAE